MDFNVTLLGFGILLLLLGLVGKVKAKEIDVGTSSTLVRLVTAIVGAVLIVLSFIPDETGKYISSFLNNTKVLANNHKNGAEKDAQLTLVEQVTAADAKLQAELNAAKRKAAADAKYRAELDAVKLKTQQNRTPTAEKPVEIACSISGLVFDSDSNKPLPSVRIDLFRDLRDIQQRPKQLKAGVATTGPNGRFSINCSWVKKSQFPLLLALRRRDWVATRITGPRIERSNAWDGINIPISMSGVDLKPTELPVGFSFSSRKINSNWFLLGNVVNKSGRSFSCIRARFKLSTSYQDKMQGARVQDLGFLDVEVRNLGPREKRPYQKKLPRRVGIGLHSKQECQ